MTPAEQRRLVTTLLRGPLEVEVDSVRRLRLHANTWLFAERWEAWETRRDLSRKHVPHQNGRLAYAVRALDWKPGCRQFKSGFPGTIIPSDIHAGPGIAALLWHSNCTHAHLRGGYRCD